MYTKVVNLLKLIISIYFVFIGVELVKIMMDQRPGDMTKKLLIATAFMLAGVGYFLWTLGRMTERLRGKMKESRTKRQAEMAKEAQRKAVRQSQAVIRRKKTGKASLDNSSLYRTAPMGTASEIVKGTATIRRVERIDLRDDLPDSLEKEQVLPESWDEKTKAMWLEPEAEEASLQRYWENSGLELELEEPPELRKGTQKLPVITQDTEEILATDGATRVIPNISE